MYKALHLIIVLSCAACSTPPSPKPETVIPDTPKAEQKTEQESKNTKTLPEVIEVKEVEPQFLTVEDLWQNQSQLCLHTKADLQSKFSPKATANTPKAALNDFMVNYCLNFSARPKSLSQQLDALQQSHEWPEDYGSYFRAIEWQVSSGGLRRRSHRGVGCFLRGLGGFVDNGERVRPSAGYWWDVVDEYPQGAPAQWSAVRRLTALFFAQGR